MSGSLSVTRRALLLAGGSLIAAATPRMLHAGDGGSSIGGSATDSSSVMPRLSEYMAVARSRPLPREIVEATKLHTLDTVAAMVSGADLPPAQVAMKFASAFGGKGTATIVGSGLRCEPVTAAFANGMRAHSDETDDSHSPSHSHPGCAIVSAALAMGEHLGISGEHLLRAIALGYDIGPRVLMTLGGQQFQVRTHSSAHSIANTFGAAAAAGCCASLDQQQMCWLLDYAAQQASGIAAWQRDTQHIEKSFVFGGGPARNGVTAALLVQLGATGVDDVFSGPDNFLLTHSPEADGRGLVDKLGEQYEVSRTNLKKWTVGSPIQAPLDALELILKEHPFSPTEVRHVEVRIATSSAKTVNNRNMPDICLQHLVAVMLVDRTVSFRAAHDRARMADAEIVRERAKIELVPDTNLERLYPQLVAVVKVTLTKGQTFERRVEAVRGTVLNPMSRQEVISKARDLMEPFLGAAQSDQVTTTILSLEQVEDLRTLDALYSGEVSN